MDGAAPTPTLPPGYSPPLAINDDAHHGAWVIICTAVGLVVILLSLLIRVYIRVKISPPFTADDFALWAATAFSIVQNGVVFGQISKGFGTSIELIPDENRVPGRKLGYAADILFVLGLYGSKISLALLFHRLSPDKNHIRATWVILGVCCISTVASVLLAAIKCDFHQPWQTYRRFCGNVKPQWEGAAALDILTEVLLFGMSIYLVWGLKTSLAKKGRVVFAFALRLPVIPISIIRINYLVDQIESDNSTLVGATAATVTQLELFYAIMAATIPCLRPFIAGFTTFYGAMGGHTIIGGSQIGTGSRKESKTASKNSDNIPLGSVDSAGNRKQSRPAIPAIHDDRFRGVDRTQNHSEITSQPSPSWQGVNGSQEMIVKKEVEWTVDSEMRRSVPGTANSNYHHMKSPTPHSPV